MDRVETYVGQSIYEWYFSKQAQNDMVGLGRLSAALMGTSGMANGLACTQTTVPSMQVSIGQGELYQVASLEATACGTLPANTTDQVLKQGILLGSAAPYNLPASSTFATPGSSGQSINYLIEAQYQDQDVSLDPTTGFTPVVLNFYNAANPATPWSGPNNTGANSNTFRKGVIAFQVKAGTAAATGTQVTPAPDSGWLGLWVVTVAFGQSTITAPNISAAPNSNFWPAGGVVQAVQSNVLNNGIDTGAANACVVNYTPGIVALTDGMVLWFKAAAANTGAATINVNGLGAKTIVGGAHSALQGGEIIANGKCNVVWNATINAFVLIECTGAALQVGAAQQSGQALNLGQLSSAISGTSGWQKLPNGIIVQWGSVQTDAGSFATFALPTAYTTAVHVVFATPAYGSPGRSVGVSAASLTSVQAAVLVSTTGAGVGSGINVNFLVIGK